MFFDSHCHLNLPEFQNDWKEVADYALRNNVSMLNVGVNMETSWKAVTIAQKYKEGVYAAIGCHPLEEEKVEVALYRELAKQPKVVAIGEIGLDFYHRQETVAEKNRQISLFLQQMRLGQEISRPVIIHCRRAYQQLLDLLKKEFPQQKMDGVIHCFEGTLLQAQHFLDRGFFLGVNGLIFKTNLDNIVKNIPLDKMLVETDSPYLCPPFLKDRRNVPVNVRYVVEKVAQIKNKSLKEIAQQTTINAKKLFRL